MGATCGTCKKDMLGVDGCIKFPVTIAGKDYDPVPYFSEERYANLDIVKEQRKDPNHRCHDCGVKAGQFHHPGCDVEECPLCHHQLISCGCLEKEPEAKA